MESAPDAKFDASTFFLFSHLTHLTAQCSSLTNSPTRGNAGNANDFRTPPALEQHRNYRVGNRRAPTPKQKQGRPGQKSFMLGDKTTYLQNHSRSPLDLRLSDVRSRSLGVDLAPVLDCSGPKPSPNRPQPDLLPAKPLPVPVGKLQPHGLSL